MKVKVGDKIYDAVDQPVMVILSENDKLNIANMDLEATKYAAFPFIPDGEDTSSAKDARQEFMWIE